MAPGFAYSAVPGADGSVSIRLVGAMSQASAGELGRGLNTLVEEGHRQVRLEFGGVSAIDAVALGALARFHVDLIQRGGALILADVPAVVRRGIEASGRASVFRIES